MLAFHSIREIRPPQRKLTPVGTCIYCRSSEKDGVSLYREHVLADGLGGDLILPAASCRPCADKIHPVETSVQTGNFGYARLALGQKSRKRRGPEKPRTFALGTGHESDPEIVAGIKTLPTHEANPDMPYAIFLEVYGGRPGLITGETGRPPVVHISVHAPEDIDRRAKTVNEDGDLLMMVPTTGGHFPRFLAKTAHAFAVAHLGIDGFEPLLVEFILEGRGVHWPDYIGLNAIQLGSPTGGIHFMALRERALANGDRGLVAILQFFGTHTTPLYEVLVGVLPEGVENDVTLKQD